MFQEITLGDKIVFTTTALLVLVKDGKVQRLTPSIQETLKSLFL